MVRGGSARSSIVKAGFELRIRIPLKLWIIPAGRKSSSSEGIVGIEVGRARPGVPGARYGIRVAEDLFGREPYQELAASGLAGKTPRVYHSRHTSLGRIALRCASVPANS